MTTSPQARRINSATESNARMPVAMPFFAAEPFQFIKEFQFQKAPEINCRIHTILKTGHVVTVEPGVYYSAW